MGTECTAGAVSVAMLDCRRVTTVYMVYSLHNVQAIFYFSALKLDC